MPHQIASYKTVIRRLAIAENIEFHSTITRQIEAPVRAAPILAPAFAAYRASFTALEEEYGRSGKSAETRELAQLDERRDALLVHLFHRIDFHAKYPRHDAEHAAAQALQFIADAYREAPQRNYEAETTDIRNLIADLHARAADVAALGLDDFLKRLDSDNETFAARYRDRLDTRQAQRERGTISALLGQVNQAFDALCQIAGGLLLTQQDAATQTALEQIASQINALVHQYSALYKRRAGTLAAKKKAQAGEEAADNQESPS
jgi:hypothetical protein